MRASTIAFNSASAGAPISPMIFAAARPMAGPISTPSRWSARSRQRPAAAPSSSPTTRKRPREVRKRLLATAGSSARAGARRMTSSSEIRENQAMSKARSFEPHPDARSGRVGLIVADLQSVHWGHLRLMMEMAGSCDIGIVAIGSTQLHGIDGHPFSFDQRKDMVQAIFGQQFKILPLQDIDASLETGDWLKYVLSRIASASLPAPTDYFTGSAIDARFYTD